MNTTFNKLIMFLGAAIMSLGLFQGAAFAKSGPPDDPLTAAVEAFANGYTTTGTTAFNLPAFVQTTPPPIYDVCQVSPTASCNGDLRFYYLGQLDDPEALAHGVKTITSINWTKASLENKDLFNSQSQPDIYDVNYESLDSNADISFYVHDNYYTSNGNDKTLYSTDDSILDPSEAFFRFYPLSGTYAGYSLNNYWLLAYTSVVDTSDGNPTYPFADGWDQIDTPTQNLTYEEIVVLFGPDYCPSPTAPEPHIYLILGTLLAGVGFVAYRKRQKA